MAVPDTSPLRNFRQCPTNAMKFLDYIIFPVHRDGWPFIAIFAVAALILAVIAEPLGWIGAALTIWCVFFFRDPQRVTPARGDLLVSPADGVVQMIQAAVPPAELDMGPQPLTRISIFLDIFDVHVNRVPADGNIVKLAYRPGKFFNAALEKASELNERQAVRMRTIDGREIAFVQIAGLVARRIRCDLRDGQAVRAGERFGLIRFGSRADVYLPEGVSSLVAVGQRMVAGETVLADLRSDEGPRLGETR
ncbi:phosphatidylserine decarboxylase [Virgifigura deserti]|uniref:phosphatidylserine decarboxylase n=1 Tax=Virgifigura deserti TaxID=2268457 RepID=UPI003CCBDB3A